MEFVLSCRDPELNVDLRHNNGKPGSTKFDLFWAELEKYLEEKSAVHEKRHDSVLFMPFAVSVQDLS